MKLKRPGRDERDSNYGTVYFTSCSPTPLSLTPFIMWDFHGDTLFVHAFPIHREQLQDAPGGDGHVFTNENRHRRSWTKRSNRNKSGERHKEERNTEYNL